MRKKKPRTVELASLDLTSLVRAGDTVRWGQSVAEPVPLARALMDQRHAIGRFNVFLGATHSDTVKPEHADCVSFLSYCGAGANRALAKARKLDILPVHYSDLPPLIRGGGLKIDVLMLQLAAPDADGNYSLSLAHEYLVPALEAARVVIAEVNAQAPWTYGERAVREDDLDVIVHTSRVPLDLRHPDPGPAELGIAHHVAQLVGDGSTLQFGLGALPEAILGALGSHRDLGIHSGAIGDKAAELMQSGVINHARKSIDRGFAVAGVIMGGKRVREYCHVNPAVQFRSTAYTHDRAVLARIERFVALNSAIEADLTGQINAETIGDTYVGAVGGALDFLCGAHDAPGGLPIVALPSRAGETSRIVSKLAGPVSTPRSDAGIIVTEFGVADLRGLTLSQRVRRMIAIAHPDTRERLEREARTVN
ncbi:MAG: acetyl-CoA hydrolase/transferase family protein [Burkholderiales bacterium]